ncbi:g7877 [Coccomyxa viridis]|uniref:G7877 protein n=1 Tax=Coccomyxa viridis TaxID=1274662 RepID=A0ABP1FYY7_9CHLO
MCPREGYISLIQDAITSWITAQHIVEVTVGKKTSWGFDARLDATAYSNLYAYFFYRNEWVERTFETFHLYDHDHGDSVVRVNQDGFKWRHIRLPIALEYLVAKPPMSTDLQVSVHQERRDARVLLPRPSDRDNFSKCAVDEIILAYNEAFSLCFQRIMNLRTLRVTHTVRMLIKPDIASTYAFVPSVSLMLRYFSEMSDIVRLSAEGCKELPSQRCTDIAERATRFAEEEELRGGAFSLVRAEVGPGS